MVSSDKDELVKVSLGIDLKDMRAYFRVCPFCLKENATGFDFKEGGGVVYEIYVFCKSCKAKWYVSLSTWGTLKGAQLVNASSEGKGNELLQSEQPLEFWQEMALKGLRSSSPSTQSETVVKEREVITREVVKVRCPYCRRLYDESDGKCPNCGASR